ncbi:MAG: hypothetical protein WA919_05275 [Coleofasciculaceae cyanobacterium]
MFNLSVIQLGNCLGLLALLVFLCTVLPTLISTGITENTSVWKKHLSKLRNVTWAFTLFFALTHGFVMVTNSEVDFFSLKTYWLYAEGISTLNLFIWLAFTCQERQEGEKKMRYFTYAGLFLIACHVWEKLINNWYLLTILVVCVLAVVVGLKISENWQKESSSKSINF